MPTISCLLVTAAGRFDYFKRSVKCYDDQTYPNKELVVVNEGPVEYQQEIADHLSARSDVKLVFLNGDYTLGALRNISIGLSSGEVFVQWDDDDFNMPERLSIQYNHLAKHTTARVCFLSDQLHYYFTTGHLFWEDWATFHSGGHLKFSLIPGTIMAWKKGFDLRYPSVGQWCSSGEDSVLAFQLCEEEGRVLLLQNMGYMQIYSYHGKNVWDVDHHLNISRQRARNAGFMIEHRDRICQTIDQIGLNGTIRVMGREGLAFMYEGKP